MIITIEINKYKLYDNLGNENCINEYKEFYINKNFNLIDIKNFMKGIISKKIMENIYQSIINNYINKYCRKYILSLSNIDKILLPNLSEVNHSTLYIGISDNGIITGIPINYNMIDKLKEDILERITEYYKNLIGLHKNKGNNKIEVGDNTYYTFDKIIKIIKKHTQIKINILKKNKIKNKKCDDLLIYIKKILEEEEEYIIQKKFYNTMIRMKTNFIMKYNLPFFRLIRSDIMIDFKYYSKLSDNDFDTVLFILQKNIIERIDVYKYLHNGFYIDNSLFPDNKKKDKYYSELIKQFLNEYNEFKFKQIKKNIKVKKINKKNPINKLNGLLSDISCFSNYLYDNNEIVYIMISISLPIIKDKNVYVGFKNINSDIKILSRTLIGLIPSTQKI